MSFEPLARVGVLIATPDAKPFGLPEIWDCGQDRVMNSISANNRSPYSPTDDSPAFSIIDGFSSIPADMSNRLEDYALCFAGLLNQKLAKVAPLNAVFDFNADAICKWVVSAIGKINFAEAHNYERPEDIPQYIKGDCSRLEYGTAIILCINERAKIFYVCALKDGKNVIDCGCYKSELKLWDAAGDANKRARRDLYIEASKRNLYHACAEHKCRTHLLDDWITDKVAFMDEPRRAQWAQKAKASYRPSQNDFVAYLRDLIENNRTDAQRASDVLDSLQLTDATGER